MEINMTDTVVDKLLLQAIEYNKIKIKEYQEKVVGLQTQAGILLKENVEYTNKYQELCPHTDVKRHQVSHMEGGYDHVSETLFEDKCTRCKKVLGSRLSRGYYA